MMNVFKFMQQDNCVRNFSLAFCRIILCQELIQQMANVEYTENVTEEQLEAMAGGEHLRYHATSFGATRSNKVP